MAELNKKLNFLKGGVTQQSKVYSTTTEAGFEYIQSLIDGVVGYIPIGDITDSRVTYGRLNNKLGLRAFLTNGTIPYTEISYTSVGTHTFTVPRIVTKIKVLVVGGGGAGAYAPSYDTYNGSDGQQSSFNNSLIAYGGKGAIAKRKHHSNDHSGYDTWEYTNGAGGTPNGKTGANNGFSLSFNNTVGTYGMGGQSYGRLRFPPTPDWRASYGGSGGFNIGYFNVKGGQTYSLTVGAGAPNNNTAKGGTSGFVLVAYGGDIK